MEPQGNAPLGGGPTEQPLESLVVVAVEGHAGAQPTGHLVRKEAVTLNPIDAKALQLSVIVDEAQPVAIGKGGGAGNVERVAPQLLDRANELAHGLGRVGREDVGLAAVQEIGGEAAVERLAQVGLECVADATERRAAVAVGMAGHDGIKLLAVGRHDVLDIAHILEPPLNLKRAGSGLREFLKVAEAVHVAQ